MSSSSSCIFLAFLLVFCLDASVANNLVEVDTTGAPTPEPTSVPQFELETDSWAFDSKSGQWNMVAACMGCHVRVESIMYGTAITDASGRESAPSSEFSAALTGAFATGFAFNNGGATVNSAVASSAAYQTAQSASQTPRTSTPVQCSKQYLFQWAMRARGTSFHEEGSFFFDVATKQYLCTDVWLPRCPFGLADNEHDSDYQTCSSFSSSTMVSNRAHDGNDNDVGTLLELMRELKHDMKMNMARNKNKPALAPKEPDSTGYFNEAFKEWQLTDVALMLFIVLCVVVIGAILMDCIRKLRSSGGSKGNAGGARYQMTNTDNI